MNTGLPDLYDSADLYDAQYDSYRDDIPWYQRLAADYGSPLLELGSGTGRLTEALAAAGQHVIGVELAPAMLERASARLAGRQLPGSVTLLQGDMRALQALPLEPESFPLVLAPFNMLMHLFTLEEQDAALRGVQELLAPGGLLALDLFMPSFGALGVLRQVPEWTALDPGAQLFLLQEVDEAAQIVTSRYYLDSVAADGTLRRRSVLLKQRYFQRFEIERALRHAGFNQIKVFGYFDQSRWQADSSHMVITAAR